MVKTFAAALFAVFMLGLVVCGTGTPSYFVDAPTFLIVVAGSVFFQLLLFGVRDTWRAYAVACGVEADIAEIRKAAVFFAAFARIVFLLAAAAFLTGMIAALGNLADPNVFGLYLAVMLLSLTYAVFFYIAAILPFQTRVRTRLAEMG